jgi:uncharacterized membrane protein
MIAVRLLLIVPMLLALALLHLIPFLPQRSKLFGVSVPPEIRYGPEGSRLIRGYQCWLLPFTIAAIAASATFRPVLIVAAIAVASFAAIGLLYRFHSRAKRFALPPPSIREVSLSIDTGGLPRRLLWFAPPLVLLAATALYLHANWNRIPRTFPVHVDFNGHPDGWSRHTVRGVFGPSVLGAFIILYLMTLYIMMYSGSRRATRRSIMLAGLAGPCYLIAVLCSLVGLLPFFTPPIWIFLTLVLAFFSVFALLMAHMLAQPSDVPPEVTPDRCWYGPVYYNPDDPAIFVEARVGGFGYTANFGRPLAWLLAALTLLFPLGLLLLLQAGFN